MSSFQCGVSTSFSLDPILWMCCLCFEPLALKKNVCVNAFKKQTQKKTKFWLKTQTVFFCGKIIDACEWFTKGHLIIVSMQNNVEVHFQISCKTLLFNQFHRRALINPSWQTVTGRDQNKLLIWFHSVLSPKQMHQSVKVWYFCFPKLDKDQICISKLVTVKLLTGVKHKMQIIQFSTRRDK